MLILLSHRDADPDDGETTPLKALLIQLLLVCLTGPEAQ